MSDRNTLTGLKVTMKKHPDSLKLEGCLNEELEKSRNSNKPTVLYDGKLFDFINSQYYEPQLG